MCVLIIAGTQLSAAIEMGIDQFKDMVGKHSDEHFFENNCGKGKLCPGGSTCVVKGVEMPCFIRWIKKGGITSTMLKEALGTFDHLNIFLKENILFVDGHG
eukprot:CAMPEP_0198279516 /NCGR_PEP_ID=MMETSP1447-20131203/66971_1 /TAXON_ID=420782 /ORGANISM="Chaetoceros dichaeta, Strain CCMP1751" /LENGTH=100 /DNA_ID=CAMNT_0043974705 /DNA_START=1137 /DNA_END=1435 /DNA_ORIENTATION=-